VFRRDKEDLMPSMNSGEIYIIPIRFHIASTTVRLLHSDVINTMERTV